MDDLASQLRQHEIESITEVKLAKLESDGRLGVLKRTNNFIGRHVVDGSRGVASRAGENETDREQKHSLAILLTWPDVTLHSDWQLT